MSSHRGCDAGRASLLLAVQAAHCRAPARTPTSARSRTRARTCRSAPASSCARSTGPSRSRPTAQIHNVPLSVPAPCTQLPHHRHGSEPRVRRHGATANMNRRHAAAPLRALQPGQQGIGCPISEPFFGAGNERTHLHLPTPYGYTNTSANWNMITHLVNTSATARTVNVEVIFRHRPLSETEAARPRGSTSTRSAPAATPSTRSRPATPTPTSTGPCRLNGAHHRHVGPPARHRHHRPDARAPCTAPRAARRSRSAPSWWAATASDYFGPVPPNNPPPADITGATLCRSEAYHGTSFGTGERGQRPHGHRQPLRHLQRPARRCAGGGLPGRRRLLRSRAIRSRPAR